MSVSFSIHNHIIIMMAVIIDCENIKILMRDVLVIYHYQYEHTII